MGKYVNEEITKEASSKGKLIGIAEASEETKGMGWAVYFHEGKLMACITAGGTDVIGGGEEISRNELSLYCDDLDSALAKLPSAELSFSI
jgi:hypothetical protein